MKNLSIKNYIYISFLSLGGDSMQFIAHIRSRDHFYQSVEEHLENVAYLGRRYGEPIGFGAHAELAGLLHDMGKFTIHFSDRKSTRLNSSHVSTSYAVFCLKTKNAR